MMMLHTHVEHDPRRTSVDFGVKRSKVKFKSWGGGGYLSLLGQVSFMTNIVWHKMFQRSLCVIHNTNTSLKLGHG